MSKTIIVSDIHIGRRDSHIKELYETIVNEPSDIIVLNGNIFDQFALWKFWNADIRNAYKKYTEMIIVPWIIVNKPPIIAYRPEADKYLSKMIKDRYTISHLANKMDLNNE